MFRENLALLETLKNQFWKWKNKSYTANLFFEFFKIKKTIFKCKKKSVIVYFESTKTANINLFVLIKQIKLPRGKILRRKLLEQVKTVKCFFLFHRQYDNPSHLEKFDCESCRFPKFPVFIAFIIIKLFQRKVCPK